MELVQIDNYYYYSQNGQLTTLILSGHNLEEELKELTKRNIRGISLNWGFCGNRIKDLDFLKDYPFINHVSIIDPDFNYDGLYYLKDLHYLQIVGKKDLISRNSHLSIRLSPIFHRHSVFLKVFEYYIFGT